MKNTNDSGLDDMYICMQNAPEKKRYVLQGIKNSLVMQEEYQKIMELRKNKTLLVKEIKTSIEELNKKYQDLKKDLPNVKNFLNHTEKEIDELEEQVFTLKKTVRKDQEDLNVSTKIRNKLVQAEKVAETEHMKNLFYTHKHPGHKKMNENPAEIVKNTDHKMNKMDRIKNNLKVIEGKIKNI